MKGLSRLILLLLLWGLLTVSIASAADVDIDFDELELGYRFSPSRQAYASMGITIGGQGRPTVVDPAVQTCSNPHALRNAPALGSEFGSASQDLEFTFTDFTATSVSMQVGKDESSAPLTLPARLEAWGKDGDDELYFITADEVELPASSASISRNLTVTSAEGAISFLRLTYGDFSASELVDCIEIEQWQGPPPEPPADTTPPEVHISHPVAGSTVSNQSATGYVDEDRGITRLTLTDATGATPLPIPRPDIVDGKLRYYLYGFISVVEGSNTLRLEAEDTGGNSDVDTVQFNYTAPDYPLPPAEVPPNLDFRASGVEVTQVIQGWDMIGETDTTIRNRTRLIAGKKTLVRLYGVALGTPIPVPDVSCWLKAYRYGEHGLEELPGSPLYAMDRITLIPGENYLDQRADITKTCDFILPPAWVEAGTIRLEATVNPWNYIPERDGHYDQMNSVVEDYTFHDTEEMCIFVYPIRSTNEGNVSPTWAESLDNIALLREIYPLNPNRLRVTLAQRLRTTLVVGGGDEDALSDLLTDFRRYLGLYYGQAYAAPCTNFVYLGLTDDSVEHRGVTNSYRPVSLSVASDDIFYRLKTAHEVGHSQGLGHVQGCSDPAAPYEPYPVYRAPDGTRYFSASIGDWGVHILDDGTYQLQDPALKGDLMSYCGRDRWMSVYTWRWLTDHYGAGDLAEANPQTLPQDESAIPVPYFLVSGMVTKGGALSLEPLWTEMLAPGSSDHVGSGDYRIRLLNSSQEVLFERRFEPTWLSDLEEYGDFLEIVPAKTGTRIVRLSGPGISKVATLAAGPSAPQVQVTTPNGGETWPARGTRTITWKAGDADDDDLIYTVLYSHDNRQTWQVIGAGLEMTSLQVILDELPGCDNQCWVRVLASDGIHQGSDSSDAAFTKEGRVPFVRILSPQPVAVFPYGAMVWLEGLATDREDGMIPDQRVFWVSGRDGILGTGQTFATSRLSPGFHRIAMLAIDSDNTWSAHVTSLFILQNFPTWMPVMLLP